MINMNGTLNDEVTLKFFGWTKKGESFMQECGQSNLDIL